MKVVILAGGKGTRLAEETVRIPKPMVGIGGRPILAHIVSYYASFGFREFLIAVGYRGDVIREFADSGGFSPHDREGVDVRVVETGENTNTGGRILRLSRYLTGDSFMLTWGDGLSDVDLNALSLFHNRHGRLATVTAVHPPPRFGRLTLDEHRVLDFDEKPRSDGGWINGAFFVLNPNVLGYIDGDASSWERDVMPRLTADNQLRAWRHDGFWQCMDNIADRDRLRSIWNSGNAPWIRETRACA